jgi:CDP-diacylglycerol--glycerol-3-phosphate 3-phosphatidyltransferase/cardiolipin synthase
VGQYRAKDLLLVPGLLSLARIPLGALFPFTLNWPLYAFGVLVLAGASDVLDGWYARTRGQVTATGSVVDAITDKIFVLAVVVSLVLCARMSVVEAMLLGTREMGELPLVIRLMLSPDARRARTERSANVPGKVATMLQFVAVTSVLFAVPHRDIYIGVAAAGGVVAAISYWARERKQ